MKILISLPVHEKSEVVLDQILNIKTFVQDPLIILHISKGFNWTESQINKNDFFKIINSFNFVLINPEQLDTIWGNITQAHIINISYALQEQIDFDYISFHSSNDLFIQKGIEGYIGNNDFGVSCKYKNIMNQYQFFAAQKDCVLLKMMNELRIKEPMKSQIEGSFYKKEHIIYINYILNKYLKGERRKGLKKEEWYSREEFYFSTISQSLDNNKTKNIKPYVFMPWSRDLVITIFDVLIHKHSKKIFGLKRIERSLNDPIRSYIRDYVGKYGDKYCELTKEKIEKITKKQIIYSIVPSLLNVIYRSIIINLYVIKENFKLKNTDR